MPEATPENIDELCTEYVKSLLRSSSFCRRYKRKFVTSVQNVKVAR